MVSAGAEPMLSPEAVDVTSAPAERMDSLVHLPPRRAEFVRQFCVDRNAAQAAIRAGYAPATAAREGHRLLTFALVRSAIDRQLAVLAEKAEADATWVRRRLKEEAEDFSEGSSPAARIRAVELIAKLNGDFVIDNKQRAGIFVDIPAEVIELVRQKLRLAGGADLSGAAGEASR